MSSICGPFLQTLAARDSQAALAISDTCSQVVVFRLERVFMQSSQATRLGASAEVTPKAG